MPAYKEAAMISAEKCVSAALRGSYLKQAIIVPGIPMKVCAFLCKYLPQELLMRGMDFLK